MFYVDIPFCNSVSYSAFHRLRFCLRPSPSHFILSLLFFLSSSNKVWDLIKSFLVPCAHFHSGKVRIFLYGAYRRLHRQPDISESSGSIGSRSDFMCGDVCNETYFLFFTFHKYFTCHTTCVCYFCLSVLCFAGPVSTLCLLRWHVGVP